LSTSKAQRRTAQINTVGDTATVNPTEEIQDIAYIFHTPDQIAYIPEQVL
jgi:hypothetical protein